MTRNKVFGEDVLIRLISDDTQKPLIIDFDSSEINSLRQNKSYKAIGKRVMKPHSHTSGYKIILSRVKRDNYIDALTQYLDHFAERGLEYPTFTVERIVNFTYSADELTKKEFEPVDYNDLNFQNGLKQIAEQKKQHEASLIKKRNNLLNSAFVNAMPLINYAVNNNQLAQNTLNSVSQINKGIQQLNNLSSSISNNVNQAMNLYNQLNIFEPEPTKEDNFEYQMILQKMREHNNFETFKTIYHYKNCTISDESFSDKPKEFTEEKITLYSSNRINLSPDNDYDDKYLKEYFNELANQKNNKMGQSILNDEFDKKINDKYQILAQLINQNYS